VARLGLASRLKYLPLQSGTANLDVQAQALLHEPSASRTAASIKAPRSAIQTYTELENARTATFVAAGTAARTTWLVAARARSSSARVGAAPERDAEQRKVFHAKCSLGQFLAHRWFFALAQWASRRECG
jgi:hypothetical protein